MDLHNELAKAREAAAGAEALHRDTAGDGTPESSRAGRSHILARTTVQLLEVATTRSVADGIAACDEMIRAKMDNVTIRHILMTRRDAARAVRRMLVDAQDEPSDDHEGDLTAVA